MFAKLRLLPYSGNTHALQYSGNPCIVKMVRGICHSVIDIYPIHVHIFEKINSCRMHS